jgi:CRISPR/Cas system-associated exonuclease Cas4 (RecB family)
MTKGQLHRLSASSIGVLLECPRCFWLQIHEAMRRPSGPFPSLPGGIDMVLKTYFDRYRRQGILPPDVRNTLPGRLFADEAKLRIWRNNREGLRHQRKDLGILLTGAIDDLLQEGDRMTPLDFKTRGYAVKEDTHEHYQHQLDIYAYLLEQNGYPTTGRGYLLFYSPEEVRDGGIVQFRIEPVEMKTDLGRAEKLLEESAAVLAKPLPARHTQCAFCTYAAQPILQD